MRTFLFGGLVGLVGLVVACTAKGPTPAPERTGTVAAPWAPGPATLVVRGVLRSSTGAWGLFCRPPVCPVPVDDHGFGMDVELRPWRDAAGAIHTDAWHALVYFPDGPSLDALERTYPKPGSMVEVGVEDRHPRAGVKSDFYHRLMFRRVDDPELSALAPPRPTSVEDPYLGKMTWNAPNHSYTGTRTIAGRPYQIFVSDGPKALPDVPGARRQVEQVEQNLDRIRREAAQRLLPTYNQRWSHGLPRDAAWLADRLHLEAVWPATDSEDPLLYFMDGGAFGVQSVEVKIKGGHVVGASVHG